MKALIPPQRESEFQATVVELLKLFHFAHYHTWSSKHSVAGFPDLIAIRGNRGLAIELKSQRGALTGTQQAWLNLFQDAVFETHVWRPADAQHILEVLR